MSNAKDKTGWDMSYYFLLQTFQDIYLYTCNTLIKTDFFAKKRNDPRLEKIKTQLTEVQNESTDKLYK